MKRLLISVFLLAMLTPAMAQNARPADPENGRKLLENEQINVREMHLKAGTKVASQAFPNTFLYALTDGALVFLPPGRTPYELTFKAGEALWLSAQQAAMANETGKDIRALLVEIKQRPPAAAKSKGKSKGTGKGSKSKAPAAKSRKK
ncbi:MAG: hypothetical protein RO009_14395 [Pseudorhodoplanes sp.]|jgi:hypothetical protein|nr:hypothetical protein [Pseudorhodoplanes sp.]